MDVELLRRVISVGRGVLSELDPEALLDRVMETAREITGARYAALGVLDGSRHQLERFLVHGISESQQHVIGSPPLGRGVLGELIRSPVPLRLADMGEHPRSYGFPVGHPAMRTFMGVPIVVHEQPWGNLYLTEKDGGREFDQADEEAVMMLADWAGIAIEHAGLYESAQRRGGELERTARGLEAARAIALAIGGSTDLDRVLELIVKRGRALVGARSLLILLREGDVLVVVASAGDAADAHGRRIPLEGSTSGEVFRHRRPERIVDVQTRLRITPERLGVKDANAGLIVPLVYRDEALGVLIAFDHGPEAGFDADDERALLAFAVSAATAVATAQTVTAERLRGALAAAEAERLRWARELHDQTLQSLGALRVLLATARRKADLASWERAGGEAIAALEQEIANLRGIIHDLRPTALDDLGLAAALRDLAEHSSDDALTVVCDLSPPQPLLGAELETTVYRLVQEALTNVAKHARASTARVMIVLDRAELTVRVQDDGVGFDIAQQTAGYGLAGMRERVGLAHGMLTAESGDAGTTVVARFPVAGAGVVARTG